MISILAQERLLGAAMGSACVGFIVFEQRRRIYDSISSSAAKSQFQEPIFGKEFRSRFALMWNKAVDETFSTVISSLTSRRQ
ncbi:hypothetical protein M5689_021917 [Euphorbia peplus]|nr:hypothetical protein M5689_021917 [Euphorbia peplus]